MTEKNTIENIELDEGIMEFAEIDGKPVDASKKEKPKKNFLHKIGDGLAWIGRKVKNSPAAAFIGGAGGTALGAGGMYLYNRKHPKIIRVEVPVEAPANAIEEPAKPDVPEINEPVTETTESVVE